MGSGLCPMFHVDREAECFAISSWLADARSSCQRHLAFPCAEEGV